MSTDHEIGISTVCAGLTRSYGGFLACRFFVGVFEAGLIPCELKFSLKEQTANHD